MHILYHLTEDIIRFGSPIFYETEKGEQFNKFIRETLFRSNRHNPSKDAAVSFGKRCMSQHVLSGGFWEDKDGFWVKATDEVVNNPTVFTTNNTRQFADNDDGDDEKPIKNGATGLFKKADGKLFVGEVQSIDPLSKVVTLKPFDFLVGNPNDSLLKRYLIPTDNVHYSLDNTCAKTPSLNLILQKSNDIIPLPEDNLKLVAILDLYQKFGDYNILNNNKFGTLWVTMTHKYEN